ncbi:MAG: hypothetical protein KAI25_05110 [Hyphomicrobiaceae bacterium]|nr:hypothetical protein [Hyphomicrobiaceae bacterium]
MSQAWGPVTFTLTHTVAPATPTELVTLPDIVPGGGRLLGVQVRRDAADTITTDVIPYWVDGGDAIAANPPPDDRIVHEVAATALTASATSAAINEDIANPRCFNKLRMGGLFAFSSDGTSTTHWTVWGVR